MTGVELLSGTCAIAATYGSVYALLQYNKTSCSFCSKSKRRWQIHKRIATYMDEYGISYFTICKQCHDKDSYAKKTDRGYEVYNKDLSLMTTISNSELYRR